MRNTTKLKRVLETHTVSISFTAPVWELTLIKNNPPFQRTNIEGKNYSEVINKALKCTTAK